MWEDLFMSALSTTNIYRHQVYFVVILLEQFIMSAFRNKSICVGLYDIYSN